MPKVKSNNITINYDQQGTGEPLILIPYAADHACYAFQVAEYAKHFTCFSVDLCGTGESDKPEGVYSTELFADDVAAFMQTAGIQEAHISGLSLGAATGIWLAAKPEYIQSLAELVRGRPTQPVPAFIQQSNAVIAHDAAVQLERIKSPTQITFGRQDAVTSTRFADSLTAGIRSSELLIFEGCAHAPIYEKTEEFNQKTLVFLQRHRNESHGIYGTGH
jgi:3-oxoadipate enol-lactonase